MYKHKTTEWEIENSTLTKISKKLPTYEECRRYACDSIVEGMTKISSKERQFFIEIPKGEEFHFIGRVYTEHLGLTPENYYRDFVKRSFVSFSIMNKRNKSRYKGKQYFFVYNIIAEDIVHIFPADADTKQGAKTEDELTSLPSLWITLQELEATTEKLEVYNQITCNTKRNRKILKPFALIAIDELSEEIKKKAEEFKIGCIIVHPDENAINYEEDLLHNCWDVRDVSRILEEKYSIRYECHYYPD